jgi:hypothetical protein
MVVGWTEDYSFRHGCRLPIDFLSFHCRVDFTGDSFFLIFKAARYILDNLRWKDGCGSGLRRRTWRLFGLRSFDFAELP